MTGNGDGPATRAPDLLPRAGSLLRPPVTDILAALNGNGIETRIVGGAVRNHLLGQPPGDVDLATTGLPDEIMARGRDAGWHAVPTGIDHGTVTLVVCGEPHEVTTLRSDVATHGRHATVAFGTDWDVDAHRRDFTMNALYVDAGGRLIDLVGGYGDVLARRVRFIGDPVARIREDFLRILRFFRFHAEYGDGAPDAAGLKASIQERNGLDILSAERIQQEMMKLMVAEGVVGTIGIMAETGLIEHITGGVPDLTAFGRLVGIEGRLGQTPDPVLRLAALAVTIVEDAARLRDRLRLSNDAFARLRAVPKAARGVAEDAGGDAGDDDRVRLYRLGPETYRDVTRIAWARSAVALDDAGWAGRVRLPETWRAPELPVSGRDLIAAGIGKGPEIGRVLADLEDAWIASGFKLSRADLLARL